MKPGVRGFELGFRSPGIKGSVDARALAMRTLRIPGGLRVSEFGV